MKAVFDGVIAEYNSKYPDVKVKLEELPWKNREQKIDRAGGRERTGSDTA